MEYYIRYLCITKMTIMSIPLTYEINMLMIAS